MKAYLAMEASEIADNTLHSANALLNSLSHIVVLRVLSQLVLVVSH